MGRIKYYDPDEVRKAVDIITGGDPYEVRIIYNDGKVRSGYFEGSGRLLEELGKVNLTDSNVYITLNKIHMGCRSRKQRDKLIESRGKSAPSTSENDVVAFRWLLIDLDPVRPSGISSSAAELAHAKRVAITVMEYMEAAGFDAPVIALSGNGVHLLYRFEAPANDENKEMLKACLEAVNNECSDSIVKIDTVNFKKAQVCKLYGTLAQKGSNTKERPFRMSKIITLEELKEEA